MDELRVCGNCRTIHRRVGGLRCNDCLDQARQLTRPGWAVVHYPSHDDEGLVVGVDNDAAILRFPGNAEDTHTFWRAGVLWRTEVQANVRPQYVEITFGEGGS